MRSLRILRGAAAEVIDVVTVMVLRVVMACLPPFLYFRGPNNVDGITGEFHHIASPSLNDLQYFTEVRVDVILQALHV
jgi:hypothetical protein